MTIISKNKSAKPIEAGHGVVFCEGSDLVSDVADFIASGGIFLNEMFAGIAVHPVPSWVEEFADGKWPIIEAGTVIISFFGSTFPGSGGPVYLRVSKSERNAVVGSFEAIPDREHTVRLERCFWTTGLVDENGNIEMSICPSEYPSTSRKDRTV